MWGHIPSGTSGDGHGNGTLHTLATSWACSSLRRHWQGWGRAAGAAVLSHGYSKMPRDAPLAPPPRPPRCPQLPRGKEGAVRTGEGDIFIVSDTDCPRLSCFTQRAKEASLCYAAAGLAAQPSEGKEERSSRARVRACAHVGDGARLRSALAAAAHSLQPTERGGKVACCLQTCLFF